MRFDFIEANRREFPVSVMCSVLDVSTSGYYAWRTRPASGRQTRRQSLCESVRAVFEDSRGIYGSPRVHMELVRRGIDCCVNTVASLMQQMGLRSRTHRRFRPRTTDSSHDRRVAPNVLNRRFEPPSLNCGWSVDITYVPTGEGWVYLAAVMDLCSRRVIGWSMADHLRTDLALSALRMAIARRGPEAAAGVIHHSDRGVQYASDAYREMLGRHKMTASMSRRGDCWDNAPMESFFGTLKSELVNHERYPTHEAARRSIFEYIEVFYNRKRIHSALGYVSPAEFEMSMTG
jgi:transposase InsO family protein